MSSRHQSSQRRREVHLWSADTRDREEGSRIESQRNNSRLGSAGFSLLGDGQGEGPCVCIWLVQCSFKSGPMWSGETVQLLRLPEARCGGLCLQSQPRRGRGGRQEQIPKGCSLSSTCMSILSHRQACTLPRISYRHTPLTRVDTKVIGRKPFCHSNSCLELGAIPLQVQLEAWTSIGATETGGWLLEGPPAEQLLPPFKGDFY